MKVWVLEDGYDGEGCAAIGVYSTEQFAREAEAADRASNRSPKADFYRVAEFEIDAPTR